MIGERLLIYELSPGSEGHRGQYLAFFQELFPARVTRSLVAALGARAPVLVPMVEESFGRYVAVALLRAMTGRRTCGLLFRPRPAIAPTSLRLRAKRALLRLMRRIPPISTLTILPFAVAPGMDAIADGWIYDPQLWDRVDEPGPMPESGAMASAIRAAAAGRKVVVAIGRQDRDKGFDRFARLWAGSDRLREKFLFAYGGKVDPSLAGAAEAFTRAGGFAENRFISDAELFDLYAAADLVWCCFAPGYDQASGVMGRACQLGVPVAVRSGSLIEGLCRLEHIAFLPLAESDETLDPAAFPPPVASAGRAAETRRRAEHSIARLRQAFGWRAPEHSCQAPPGVKSNP